MEPVPIPVLAFRDVDEVNLWNQWATNFAMRFEAEEAQREADKMLTGFRERMKGVILQHKPGRA